MTLKIDVYTKDLELTDRIHDYATKKVGRLERFLNEIDDCRVDLGYVKTARNASDRYIAQVTIRGRGFILRAEERADNIFAAIDATVDKMTRQIERFKGKHWHHRGEGAISQEVEAPVEELEDQAGPAIVRRKSFALTPMDELEALEQLQLLGHEDFFVFYNSKTSKINVLYKRRDGTYGLIDPIIG
ncbi:MAG: ribosome-associated translation inhibitor RaiA [Anaerolineaceae bacterium]